MTYSPELWTVTSLSTQAEVTAWSDGRFKVLSRPDDFLAAVRHALAYRTWGSLSIWSARFLSAILIHVAFDPTHGPGATRNLVEVLMTTRPPDRLADMIDRGLGMFAPRDHPVGLIGTLAMIDYLERTGDTKGVLPVTFRMDGAIQYPPHEVVREPGGNMNPENFEDFLRELPEFLREKFGADAKIVMGAVNLRSRKPVAVRDGFVGRVRWEIRLMPDDSPSHEIFVELPKRVHPRLHGKIGELLESYQPQDAHTCAEGPREWHKALHLTVAQDTACEEVAASLAKVIDQCRISRVQQAWVKFRVWLAARILPAGLEIS